MKTTLLISTSLALFVTTTLMIGVKAVAGVTDCSPQCLMYVQKKLPIGGPYGTAKGFWELPQNGYIRVEKNPDCLPLANDVLFFDRSEWGHVAVITEIEGNDVYVDDSNYYGGCKERKHAKVSLNDSEVLGWLTKVSNCGINDKNQSSVPQKNPYFTPSAPPVFCYTDTVTINQLNRENLDNGSFRLVGDVFLSGNSDAALEILDRNGNLVETSMISGLRRIPKSIKEIAIDNNYYLYKMLTDEYKCGVHQIVGKCDHRDHSSSKKSHVDIVIPEGGDAILTRRGNNAIAYNLMRWSYELLSEAVKVDSNTINDKRNEEIFKTVSEFIIDIGLANKFYHQKLSAKDLSGELFDLAASVVIVLLDPSNVDGRTMLGKFLDKKVLEQAISANQLGMLLNVAFKTAKISEFLVAVLELQNPGADVSLVNCKMDARPTTQNVDNLKSISSNNYSENSISVALVLDRSGSMKEVNKNPDGSSAQKLEKAKQASKSFILAMDDTDQVSISSFSDKGSTQQHITSVAQVKDKVESVLEQIKSVGATNIGAGLKQGFQQLSKSNGLLKTALLLSDGENNRDKWEPVAEDYEKEGWPVCTIGFGKITKKAEAALRKIATDTGCTYVAADTFDVIGKYQQIGAYVKGDSTLLVVNDMLAINGTNIYEFTVSAGTKGINVNTSWGGSLLSTVLIDPMGNKIDVSQSALGQGRYVEGDDFQYVEVKNAQFGKWKIETRWAEAPKIPEQVNILVSEKSDVFSQILAFRPQYKKGQSVTINVVAKELEGIKKNLLGNVSVKAEIQKPGAQLVSMIEAQSTNWTMYKDVVIDVTRDLELFDDGQHDDYKAGDGIFGNTFTETDKQGSYLVAATVNGQKHDGQSVEKKMLASFQVGPITQNRVSNTQTLQYMGKAQGVTIDNTSSYSELLGDPLPEIHNMESEDPLLDIQDSNTGDPLEKIERMQGSDPMDEINQMLD